MKKHIVTQVQLRAKKTITVTSLGRVITVPAGQQFYLEEAEAEKAVTDKLADFDSGLRYGPGINGFTR